MKIVITGGCGFLGKRLAKAILDKGSLVDSDGQTRNVRKLVLFDRVKILLDDDRIESFVGDITSPADIAAAIGDDTDSIFHLAAIVSADAEENFDLGMSINLGGTRHVLEAARALAHRPKLVFSSSIATYGGDLPDIVTDDSQQVPQTSYGAAKAAGELLVQDYSRKGFIDGRSLRLPTITVRTGLPNKAASTWASSIIREPLSGKDAVCPVRRESPMACMSPRRIIDAFIHAHDLPSEAFGPHKSLLLSGISISAGEMADAVDRHRGNRKVGNILWQHDAAIQKIVDGWPKETWSARAEKLGFGASLSADEIVQSFIDDDLDDQLREFG